MKLKENDNVPEIRFDYFKEEWDRKRFKDFTKLSQGLQIAISSRFLEDGEHRYFYITNEFLNPNSTKKYYIESPSENVICTVDDILMTRTGNTGKVITNISGAFHNNFFKVDYDKFETSKMFLYYLLTSNDIQKEIIIRAGNSTIPDLNHSDFYSIKTSVPALAEQTAIGSLFRTIDDLLASYKDNLTNYQSLKVTMLSKMFPKAGQTVPEIRLDGFEGEWVEKRLKDISKRVTRKNNDLVSERALTISAQFGLIDQEEFFQKKIASKDVSGYYLIKKGEFAYNKSYSTGYPLGAIKRLDKYENGVLSTLYILFKAVDVDSDYLAHYYESDKWHREVSMCAAEGARNHGLLNIAPADFFNTRLVVPKELEEQRAIGSYFSNLDNLINSHQEKISQLETLKKKLLQDMFI
ncbi:restriction endonuclease subunit S [Streptococcus sp. HMSC034E03]|uniref:restriction endonuclease subunit S n=1 Tax=Streptococcus sp. HMSC034E03 TaxID=1739309 RepID=UPI0009F197E2|nr:restriction endonuclease subunit S [Streptococcus sp. HMSC034E03]